jgi:CDP-paratose 2-epimerase
MSGRVLITGGAGFVGTNLADRLLDDGHRVTVLDDLSRAGVAENLAWLEARHGSRVRAVIADVADRRALRGALEGAERVFHLAAQVAVTTSLDDPEHDAHANFSGTLALLEEIRRRPGTPPTLLFTSTNKVYGGLEDVPLREGATRYEPSDPRLRGTGIDESRPLAFCTPYGCSKGAADQYVLDYAHSYGLPTVVFRMSCIYGPHQFGNEDQGWVAHFLIRALEREPITIYGDGKQVRDVLYVEDLVEAMQRVTERPKLAGRAFNVGGGPENCISLLELLDMIEGLTGEAPELDLSDWRPGDQRYYVSDTRALRDATGWRPAVGAREGVRRLYDWLARNRVSTGIAA